MSGSEDSLLSRVLQPSEAIYPKTTSSKPALGSSSVLPRLLGHSSDINRALETMHEQHVGHESRVRTLLNASSSIRRSPRDKPRRVALALAATKIGHDFSEHLFLEETVVFATIRRLIPTAMQEAILGELHARRRQ